MEFSTSFKTNGLQKWIRLYINTDDPKYNTHVDIREDEIESLKEVIDLTIEQLKVLNEVQ